MVDADTCRLRYDGGCRHVQVAMVDADTCTLGEITLSFATCGTVHHWRAGSEVALET